MLALALVHEADPALEHVEHLEVAVVLVQAGRVHVMRTLRVLLDPDHVGAELSMRRLLDAEIAVLHEAAQPCLVLGALGPAHAEALLPVAHRPTPLAFSGGGAPPPR